jgi:hypothetical protein
MCNKKDLNQDQMPKTFETNIFKLKPFKNQVNISNPWSSQSVQRINLYVNLSHT